ncbi:CGNR zinc finger domain-containing protein [Saccharomonospora azurea]|uniref:CGNR zinc finger domain-containing protein n=1 Tax=Saccharomonospora azurea TaxID=40988 RepID=UPI003D89E452
MDADVTLLLDFLNTVDVEEGTDVLATEQTWSEWAAARDLPADPLRTAAAARDALRTAAGSPAGEQAEIHDLLPPLAVTLSPEGVALAPATAVAAVLAAAARLTTSGQWDRIKICPAENCRWAFHDRSPNRSRAWCSMRVCGNRQKVRSYRRRSTSSSVSVESS